MATEKQIRGSAPPGDGGGTTRDAAFVSMHGDPRFVELKRRLFVFVFPMSLGFLAWYLLYVLMSAFARDLMGTVLFGTVNVALVFGVLQFVSTFGIAVLYTLYARRRLDGLATELREELPAVTEEEGR
ncbi:hypothetical protein BJF83_10460 [Nocardiopsis sp. CNR-923]|uniref:DUF485 domain-containing protein n=1 Tax=Nocardiopsis sp. CNR-923 TaxID=1904965 RepID=UPI000962BB41|nr:DUF485 domain-containing protein [Nocardiopsis sp. CNR-923]OLT29772.1 hypothetical protein BJF83_10460 [Nocardiopsis sp. CNR-923]